MLLSNTTLLVLLFACSTSDSPQKPNYIAQWEKNKEEVIDLVAASTDSIEQLHIVMELSERYPGETQKLCPFIEDKNARKRCERINERPHLWSTVRSEKETSLALKPQKQLTVALAKVEMREANCSDDEARNNCIEQKASEASVHGNIKKAAGLCYGIADKKWRGECLFQAAESALSRRGSFGYSDAVELCMVAKPFEQNCQSHLIMLLSSSAPSAHCSDPKAWAKIRSAANAVRATWSWRDKKMAQLAYERLWSEALGLAYASAKPITGDPLSALPESIYPHIRSAVMRRLMAIDPPSTHNLNTWIDLGKNTMLTRKNGSPKRDTQATFRSVPDLWDDTSPYSDQTIAYMATSKRLWSQNPEIDLAISTLEAAARQPPHHNELLEEGLKHPDPLVQATATRLLGVIQKR